MPEAEEQEQDPYEIVGEAVLLDYPLRIWARQQEHTDEVLREFMLLLSGEESGTTASAPAQLVGLATMFSTSFGALIDQLTVRRQERYDAGDDRMDLTMPLPRSTPQLMERVAQVWAVVDDYCSSGELLALARTAEVVALMSWSAEQLTRQARGEQSQPWPGPW